MMIKSSLVLLGALGQGDAQTAVDLFQQAHALENEGCTITYPRGQVNGGGHRRHLQLGLGGLTSQTCSLATVQDRAAEVDAACCPGDSCGGQQPSSCDYHCASHFVPFYADCGTLLSSVGQDMSAVNDMCTPSSTSQISKAVQKAVCPDAILSCHNPTGPILCVDATTGGGANPAELSECTSWTSQGGGWRASGEPCGGIEAITGSANLIQNGDFETPTLAQADCMGGHDSSYRGDDHCQYKYFYPPISEFCHADCQITGWQIGEADTVAARGAHIALAENGNTPWGGLDSHMGRQYLVLQNAGTYAQQTLFGLQRGSVYEVRLRMANRPGYGDEESVVIKVDNHVVGESSHPPDDFEEFGTAFTARSSQPVLRIENDTPSEDDTALFIDEVTVTPVQLGAAVAITNGGFDDQSVTDDGGFSYTTPQGWSSSGSVLIQSGASPWGGVPADSGTNFLGLQGMGAYVEQAIGGLTSGTTYVVQFSFGDRPGYGEDEMMHVKLDGVVIWESMHPEDGMSPYSAVFTAEAETAVLRFENDSPEGDRSVFLDSVSIFATANGLSVVLPDSSSEKQLFDFQLLNTPMTWDDAEAECERRNRRLASVHSIEENNYIATLHHADDAGLYDGVWIGARDAADGTGEPDCCWSWADGTEFDWHNWGAGEPNNGRATCPADIRVDGTCGENAALIAAHFSTWDDHPETGGGNERDAARSDYQWNDGGSTSLEQAVCGAPSQTGSRTILAYYSFDDATPRDWSGNHRDGTIEGGVTFVDTGVSGKSASFDGTGRIVVSAFRNWAWGQHFAVSTWFMRSPDGAGNYEGIINNGYYTHGSWEIRMGREMGGTSIGGGIITEGHDEAWDVNGLGARVNVWHHVALVYDSDTVHFYLDGQRTTDQADHGDIVARATDVVIGQAGTGSDHEYFTGLIDEVKIFSRALGHDEVLEIFRSTVHNGGHCENQAAHSHCDTSSGDGNFDYCDGTSARQVHDLGAAHGTVGQPEYESGIIGEGNEVCHPSASLIADGQPAGLARNSRNYGVLDGHAVTACLEVEWDAELMSSGIRFAAASSDEEVCQSADYNCASEYCGTGGSFLVFASGGQRAGLTDYSTFFYQGTATIATDDGGAGNGVDGAMLFDEMTFDQGEQAVQYLMLCRSGAGRARDNILIDYVALRASARDYEESAGSHCDPRPAPPPPPRGEAFAPRPYFNVNSYDGVSYNGREWVDVAGTGSEAAVSGAHFVQTTLPKHFQFDGDTHFVFDDPAVFDFRGDFSVSVTVRPPPNLEPFHMLLSRRRDSDWTTHHQLFIDTRSTWVGDWLVGEPVAVFFMGTGSSGVWAYTAPFAVGDFVHLTFVVSAGRICGYINGVRSGDCSANLRDDQRQLGTGVPLEVGGEDSYTSHPLWSMASVIYYDRALSEEEVSYNYAASNCLELESGC